MAERFLLVNPPSPPGFTANREGAGGLGVLVPGKKGFVYPQLFLAQMAARLRASGHEVAVIDAVLAPRFARRRIRSAARRARVLVRSSRATDAADREFARSLAGAAVRCVRVGPLDEEPRGEEVIAPDGFGAAELVLGETPSDDPERWPFAAWAKVPLGRSRRLGFVHTFGCHFGCRYCPYVVAHGRTLRARSTERSLAEWRHQLERLSPKRVVFRDPSFGIDRESTLGLLRGIAALPPKLRAPFEIESRPELLDGELLDALQAAGCVEIKLGVESLEAEALVASGRLGDEAEHPGYTAAVDRIVGHAEEAGIALRVFLLSGLPGATPEGDAESDERFRGFPLVHRKALQTHELGEMG